MPESCRNINSQGSAAGDSEMSGLPPHTQIDIGDTQSVSQLNGFCRPAFLRVYRPRQLWWPFHIRPAFHTMAAQAYAGVWSRLERRVGSDIGGWDCRR